MLFRCREIGSANEGFKIRSQPNIQRPTSGPVRRFDESYVNIIYVRPFFAIHFDTDKVGIHDLGNRRVGVRLAFHDVTPMTG